VNSKEAFSFDCSFKSERAQFESSKDQCYLDSVKGGDKVYATKGALNSDIVEVVWSKKVETMLKIGKVDSCTAVFAYNESFVVSFVSSSKLLNSTFKEDSDGAIYRES